MRIESPLPRPAPLAAAAVGLLWMGLVAALPAGAQLVAANGLDAGPETAARVAAGPCAGAALAPAAAPAACGANRGAATLAAR